MFRLGSLYRSERKLGSTSQAWHQGVAPSLPVPASPNIARSTESFGGAHIGSRPEGCSHQISISHPIQSVKVSLLASIFEKRLENGMYGQEGCLYDVLHIRFSNTHISYIYIRINIYHISQHASIFSDVATFTTSTSPFRSSSSFASSLQSGQKNLAANGW